MAACINAETGVGPSQNSYKNKNREGVIVKSILLTYTPSYKRLITIYHNVI